MILKYLLLRTFLLLMLPFLLEQLRLALDWSFLGSLPLMLQYPHSFDMAQCSHSLRLMVHLFPVTCTDIPIPASFTLQATPIHGLSLPKSPLATPNSLPDAPAPLPFAAKPIPAPKNLSSLHQLLLFVCFSCYCGFFVYTSAESSSSGLQYFLWFIFQVIFWERKWDLFLKVNWVC